MATVFLPSHYFDAQWSVLKIKKVRRALAFQLHPDRNQNDANACERMKYVNAEADQVERYARQASSFDANLSVYQRTGKHYDEMSQSTGSASGEARRQAEDAERQRRADSRQHSSESRYGKSGDMPNAATPPWRVKQERMF